MALRPGFEIPGENWSETAKDGPPVDSSPPHQLVVSNRLQEKHFSDLP